MQVSRGALFRCRGCGAVRALFPQAEEGAPMEVPADCSCAQLAQPHDLCFNVVGSQGGQGVVEPVRVAVQADPDREEPERGSSLEVVK